MPRLLIVEDEDNLRELYAEELEEEGYEIIRAENGKTAVDLVKKEPFDLIIMDIRMPEMDGIEALGKVITQNKKIPVIIYTAYSNYKSNFMTWTADAYLTKSSNLDELKEKIKEFVSVTK
jgi:DNA-binding response OmpR family regulator